VTIELSEKIAFLKGIHLFHHLEEDELESIGGLLLEVSHATGEVIFEQGKRPESFYLIHGGNVRITRRQERKESTIAQLVKEDYFGEMGLIAKRPRSGTAVAVSDVALLVMSRDNFEKFYRSIPQLRLNFDLAIQSRLLARRLQFKWLQADEVIYFLARKHPIILYQRLVLPFFALVPLFFLYAWLAIAGSWIVGLASLLSSIALVLWVVWIVIDWGNDYYIVTNQRVVWLEKVIGIYDSRQESPLSTILSVAVETTQLGRILDYGDVIIRTWVGRIPFRAVSHPQQAQDMIEEYWERTKEQAVGLEKEAMKDAIRRQLGIANPPPTETKPAPPVQKPSQPKSKLKNGRLRLLRLLGADTLKLRYEAGESVFYRKHLFVLVRQALMPISGVAAVLGVFLWRLISLARSPQEALVRIVNGAVLVDPLSLAILLSLVPLLGWLLYEVLDWSNDQFEVTPEQIIDLDKKPFGTQTRNAAQLDSILGTEAERIGILGQIFNYGNVYITVGGSKLAFEDVIDPAGVQADIDRRRAARRAKQEAAKIAAERERMAEWLATYHMNADKFTGDQKKQDQKPG
jgi:hypothetical protein